MPTPREHPPAAGTTTRAPERVTRVLTAADPRLARRWERELSALCDEPGSTASRLCANGDPIEFAFAWPHGAMRVTCDPSPGAGAAQRLIRASELCGPGMERRQLDNVAVVAGWAGDGRRYGAWVGSRGDADGMRRKLYVEIAEDSPWRVWPPARRIAGPGSPAPALRAVMAGFDASGAVEVYFRTRRIHPDAIGALLAHLGIATARRALQDEVARLTGRAVRDHLPGDDHGVSVAFGPDGEAARLTWYAHADALLGPAPGVRAAYLRAGLQAGWPMREYRAVSAPDPTRRVPWHGLAGVAIGRDGELTTSITVALRPAAWDTP